MADLWEDRLHVAIYGGLELDLLSTEDAMGRDLVTYPGPHQEGGRFEDMGGEPRSTACRVIFFQRSEDDDHLARFADFDRLKRTGEAHTFTHPLTGSYQARIGRFTFAADANLRDCVMVDVSFMEDIVTPAIFDLGAGAPTMSATQEIAAVSAELTTALDRVTAIEGLISGKPPSFSVTVGADALALVTSWANDAQKAIGDVRVELEDMRARIDETTRKLELATNVRRWPILRSLVELEGAVRRAAEVFTDRTPRILEMTIKAPVNLMTFIARRYGASQVDQRMAEMMRLNSIPNPARLEAGTVLRGLSPDAPRRAPR